MPDGGLQTVVYDNMNNVLTKTVKINLSNNIVYSFEYNNVYKLTKSIEEVGGMDITTTQNYDILHRLIKITDSSLNETVGRSDIKAICKDIKPSQIKSENRYIEPV